MRGRIRHFIPERGFGFIRPDGSAEDVFFHVSKVLDGGQKPRKGARAEFWLGDAKGGGKQAVRVFVLEPCAVEEE